MKKLPKVYQNNFTKKIDNNKEVCYLRNEQSHQKNTKNIDQQLLQIFSGVGYSYNIPVRIKTLKKTYETSLVAKTKNNIITLDNDVIPIKDIQEIEIKK